MTEQGWREGPGVQRWLQDLEVRLEVNQQTGVDLKNEPELPEQNPSPVN